MPGAKGERSNAVFRRAIGDRSDAVFRRAIGERSDAVFRRLWAGHHGWWLVAGNPVLTSHLLDLSAGGQLVDHAGQGLGEELRQLLRADAGRLRDFRDFAMPD